MVVRSQEAFAERVDLYRKTQWARAGIGQKDFTAPRMFPI